LVIIIGFIPGLKMQIDGIKARGWDYFSIVMGLLVASKRKAQTKRINRRILYDFKKKGES